MKTTMSDKCFGHLTCSVCLKLLLSSVITCLSLVLVITVWCLVFSLYLKQLLQYHYGASSPKSLVTVAARSPPVISRSCIIQFTVNGDMVNICLWTCVSWAPAGLVITGPFVCPISWSWTYSIQVFNSTVIHHSGTVYIHRLCRRSAPIICTYWL